MQRKDVSRVIGIDFAVRLVKGIVIGIGAIIPGLSGGVLAVVFGIYEPALRRVANFWRNFWDNVLYFAPLGLGMAIGVFAFSAFVDFALTAYAAQFIWLFVGFVAGTVPSIYRTAGEQGRKPLHLVVMVLAAAGIMLLLHLLATSSRINLAPSLGVWLLSGALIGLGVVIPGLSTSNFLIYLNLYQPMAESIVRLDFAVLTPLALGLAVCVLALAKVVTWAFNRYHGVMYHAVLGVVIGSTLSIMRLDARGGALLASAVLFLVGAAASWFVARLDEQLPERPSL